MNNYERLIVRLDAFIRKYYTNQLIRGVLVFIISLLLFVLLVSVGEYYLYMPVWLRVGLMSFFTLAGVVALGLWVIKPLVHMNRLGKIISHEQAANIIGQHFPEVSDKLLNILQLKRQSESQSSRDLIEASIDQKSSQLSVVPIAAAIDFSKNKKYLPYLLPLVLVGVFMLVAAPNIFRDASERLLQPTKTFERPAPFSFHIQNSELKAVRNSDFQLTAFTKGDVSPSELFIEIDEQLVPMSVDDSNYAYTFRNITTETTFRLFGGGFYSKEYKLSVVQKPVLKSFNVKLDYPSYIGKEDEVRNSLGDMTIPAGTKVTWQFQTEFTDFAALRLGDGNIEKLQRSGAKYNTEHRFLQDTTYTLMLKNSNSGITDSFKYKVTVIPDKYPVIQLQEFRDTVSGNQVLLSGSVGDDYGISKVLFRYEVADKNNKQVTAKSIPLDISKGALTPYQYYFDIQTLKLTPGQKVTYFIEAWDNDGVMGSKASRSEVMTYMMYSPKQLDSALNANAKQINSGLSNSAEQTKQLQDEYKDMEQKLLQSKGMDWEQQESIQNIMKMQQSLQDKLEAVKKRFDEQKQQAEQKQYSEDLKEKQKALEKQLDNLLDKELQEQMKKLEELMKRLNKDDAFKAMQQLQQDNKLFNMDLERMKELMKKMELQMRMEDVANKMKELAQKQLDLKQKTDAGKESTNELKKEQDALKKELDKALGEDMKKVNDLNEQQERPGDMSDPKSAGEQAKQNMSESSESLQKQQSGNSSKSQSKAAQNLQSMANSLSAMAAGMNAEQINIDIKATRQILTNLMRLSFDQEQLMGKVAQTPITSQAYIANQQEQKRMHANSIMIRDSLFALSKRVEKLSENINKETTELETNMQLSVRALEDRKVGDAVTKQQYVMTHTNNLALMLNEVLENLLQMKNMAQQQQGNKGQCNNPGGQTPKPGMGKQLSDIITEQKQLGNQMQQMNNRQQGKKGSQQDGKDGEPKSADKKGTSGSSGEYGDAEQLAKLAQQQAALRKKLRELNSLLNSSGMGDIARELREVQDEMDKTETDLVNKRLTSELVRRQKEILTKLLEAEKSVREQQQDNKRSSNVAENISRPIPDELKKQLDKQNNLQEQYKTTPPQLKPYYKSMVENYYRLLGTK